MITKFKFWDKDNNEFILFPHNIVLNIDGTVEGIEYEMPREGNVYNDITYFELLQSTGLLDKNGKEIFEGDILHHKVQGTGVVFYPYRDTMASFGIRNVNTNFGRNLQDTAKAGYEVIGNKFEHPHLLGEE
ncbi:YopX family protein [Mammaliicoccus sciuri]